MTINGFAAHSDMPSSLFGTHGNDRVFYKILFAVLFIFVSASVIIQKLEFVMPELTNKDKAPPYVIKLSFEEKTKKKPEITVGKQPASPLPEKRPEEPVIPEKPAEPPKPKEIPPPAPKTTEEIREKVSQTGLLAFSSQLADLKNPAIIEKISQQQNTRKTRQEIKDLPDDYTFTTDLRKPELATDAGSLFKDTLETNIDLSTRDRLQTLGDEELTGTGSPNIRPQEEIQMVLDRNKSAVYSLYNRALRRNPGLRGKVVLKITIEPSGQVSACEILSSELNAPELERKLVARLKLLRFESRDVETMILTYPIDFIPS